LVEEEVFVEVVEHGGDFEDFYWFGAVEGWVGVAHLAPQQTLKHE